MGSKIRCLVVLMGLCAAIVGGGCWGTSSSSSSSTGGTDVTGLEIASEVSMVDAQDVAVGSNIAHGIKALVSKALTTNSSAAYYTDPLDVWVYDDSMESLSVINEILCSFDQTRYADMVNEGNYIALIDNAACSQADSKASDQGNQSTGADSEDLETWVLNSSRANDTADQIVTAWIEDREGFSEESGDEMMIHAKATISEGVSATNPFGKFRIDFEMRDLATEATVFASGYLQTVDSEVDGQVEFEFSMGGTVSTPMGDIDMSESVHVVTNVEGTEGYALASHDFSSAHFSDASTYNVAYNENYYHTTDSESGDEKCLDRVNFDNMVFRYGLYGEDGSRVEVSNPGFGIKYGAGDDMFWGWAGYYGVWLPDEVTVTSGIEVVRANNDGSSGAAYTTFVAPGKFIKHTQEGITLGDIKSAILYWWDDGTNYRVEWDGSAFTKTGAESCSDSGCTWADASGAVDFGGEEWASFWMDGLGNIFFEIPEGALSDATVVTFDKNEVLTSGAADFAGGALTLNCYQDCLGAGLTDAQLSWQEGATPFLAGDGPFEYTISPTDMTLMYAEAVVEPADGVTSMDGPNSWGVQSGPMVLSSVTINDPWEVYDQATYYTWETGVNDWNKYIGLIDGDGAAVAFTRPLRLDYTHTDGIRYSLEYNGFGELHGIPWEQVEGTDRWYPEFSIDDGSAVTGDASPCNTTSCYVRALEIEQKMSVVADSNCSGLSFGDLDAPEAPYVEPNIGGRPDVTDDPKVIKGELTGS